MTCPNCGALEAVEAKFCGRCGHALAPPPGPAWQDEVAAANETYTGNRLLYNRSWEVETAFASRVTLAALRSFLSRALLTWILVTVVGVLFSLVAGGTSGFSDEFGVWEIFALLAALATFFMPYREAISEWRLTMDGKGHLADSAYAVVYRALKERDVPVAPQARRIRDRLRPGSVRNMLTIRQDRHTIYVCIFAYGHDLYLGWTMWWVQLPVGMFFSWIGDGISSLAGRGSLFHMMLRSFPAQALRESLHSALREGIESAARGEQVAIATTFGTEIQIEDWGSSPQVQHRPQHLPGQRPPAPERTDSWPPAAGQ